MMKREQGILWTITLILFFGIVVTYVTSSYIKSQEQITIAEQATENSNEDIHVFQRMPQEVQAEVVEEFDSVPISPLGSDYSREESGVEDYQAHLLEVQLQIEKIRRQENDTTTYSLKQTATRELNIWEKELNNLYTLLETKVDESQFGILKEEAKQWLKGRDTKAFDVARKYTGTSVEGLEYTASLVESTRQRVYDLAFEYGLIKEE